MLLYNSMLILVLVLRYTITVMRELGIGAVLPLDNNIYLHKVLGYLIFTQASIHTVMHLCNFGELHSANYFSRFLQGYFFYFFRSFITFTFDKCMTNFSKV